MGVGLNEDPKCERVGLTGGSSLVREVDFTCQGNNGDRITVRRNGTEGRWVVSSMTFLAARSKIPMEGRGGGCIRGC